MISTFFFLVSLFLISCQESPTPPVKPSRELSPNSKYYHLNVEEYTYQGCEYIVVGAASHRWGSHKGNCKNPIHNFTK